MRTLQYLSPTSIDVFRQSPEQFYLQYLADARPPRPPQTQPMAIGSAFDAYAKSFLHEALFGKGFDPKFELETLLEVQVDPHNLGWAREHGKHAFACYRECGALNWLHQELEQAKTLPCFELEVRGEVGGVQFLGKPDIHFMNSEGTQVIFDWKVNGYCAKRTTSPALGYVDLWTVAGRRGPHPKAVCTRHRGAVLNNMHPLNRVDERWATQLSIYAWLCGVPVGGEFVAAIDQLVCSPNPDGKPIIRVANHRTTIAEEFQEQTFDSASEIWFRCQSTVDYFPEVGPDESAYKCSLLEQQAKELCRPADDKERWFAETCCV